MQFTNKFGTKSGTINLADLDTNFDEVGDKSDTISSTVAQKANTSYVDAQILAAKDRRNHTFTDDASNILFSDGSTLQQWRASIEALIGGQASAPVVTTDPGVPTGTKTVGSTLTFGTLGSVTDGSGGAHTDRRQWNRVNLTAGTSTPIPGYLMSASTPTTYVLAASDLDFYISGSQQAQDNVNGLLSNIRTSVVTAIITGTRPTNSVAPTISPSGTQDPGTQLTCSTGTWANASTYGYLFYDNGVPVGSRSATATYTPQSEQAGHTITADVLATSSLSVPAAAAVAASNSITISGTNTVVNTVLPTITRANGEGAGIIFKGFTYPIVAGTWTLNGNSATPANVRWDFYKNGVFYASNASPSFNVDANYLVNDIFKLVETVTISGTSYASSLTSATAYTVNAAPATLTVQVNTASATFTQGAVITPYVPVTATGGTTPYSYSVNPSLPSTLSLNTSNGTISGTANTVGSASYTITVTDAVAASVNGSTQIAIQSAVAVSVYASLDAIVSNASQVGGTHALQIGVSSPNQFPLLSSISDTLDGGITFTGTVDGTTQRFGKKTRGGRTVYKFAYKITDTLQGGRIRVEDWMNWFNKPFTNGQVFWIAIEQEILSGALAATDNQMMWQIHTPDQELSVIIQCNVGNGELSLPYRYSPDLGGTEQGGVLTTLSTTAGVFQKWVYRLKHGYAAGTGQVQVWRDGTQVYSNTSMQLGAPYASEGGYFKLGWHNTANDGGSFDTGQVDRCMYIRKCITAVDAGSQYSVTDLMALLT